jgi:hypothetical protein
MTIITITENKENLGVGDIVKNQLNPRGRERIILKGIIKQQNVAM